MAAHPLDDARATTNGSTAATNKVCNLPAAVGAGMLLILILRSQAADTHSLPTGWNWLVQNDASDGSDDTTSIIYKFTDGTEGTTVTVNGTASLKFASICWRIRAGGVPQINAAVTGSSTTPDPGTFSPTGGSMDWLWLWIGGWEGEQTSPPTGQPTNYVNPVGANSGTTGNTDTNMRVAGATRKNTASSEDPGSWTISVTDQWTAWTIAIPPVAAFTDDFDRADNTDLGADWDSGYDFSNALQIVGNEIRLLAVNTGSVDTINTAVPADQYAAARVVTFAGAQLAELAIWLRTASPPAYTNYRFIAWRNEGGARTSIIIRSTAGAGTDLVSESATTWAAGDVMRAEIQGSALRMYRNGTLLLSTTDTNHVSGRPGAQIYIASGGSAANAEWDNFEAGRLAMQFRPEMSSRFVRKRLTLEQQQSRL